MDENITSIDTIRADARKAAEGGHSPLEACRYPFGSPGAKLWMLEYSKTVNRLHRQTAGQQPHKENDE